MGEDSEILSGLDDNQKKAVLHGDGPLLILAGAGSGKTRVITRRISHLVRVKGVHPSTILAVTFTNKAAHEMRQRVENILGYGSSPTWIGTFHSMCLRLLRINYEKMGYPRDFTVLDDDDTSKLLRNLLKDLGIPKERQKAFESKIDKMKNDGIEDLDVFFQNRTRDPEFEAVYVAYTKALKDAGAMDFGDLLLRTLVLLRNEPGVRADLQRQFSHLLVDEFQDTNLVQYEILKLLVGERRNLVVVGDDDQSIYSWRGARIENILEFNKDFSDAAVVTLATNYRSREPILEASARVIGFNRKRHQKDLRSDRGAGEQVVVHRAYDETAEARFVVSKVDERHDEGVDLASMAIFYRTNAQSRVFEDQLRLRRIPYRVVGGMKFYQRREVKDVLAYLRLLVNPADSISAERIVNVPPRGLGAKTVEKAKDSAATNRKSFIEALAAVGDDAGGRTGAQILKFINLIADLAIMTLDKPASAIVRETVKKSGYGEYLENDDSLEGQSRMDNVEELLKAVQEFEASSGSNSLRDFLDRVALVQPLDEGGEGSALNLMTIHAAKGLEFDTVWVSGLEDGLFPLQGPIRPGNHSMDPARDLNAVEEERRLMYVAMTRARERLTLTWAATRVRYGEYVMSRPSRFLAELPRQGIKIT